MPKRKSTSSPECAKLHSQHTHSSSQLSSPRFSRHSSQYLQQHQQCYYQLLHLLPSQSPPFLAAQSPLAMASAAQSRAQPSLHPTSPQPISPSQPTHPTSSHRPPPCASCPADPTTGLAAHADPRLTTSRPAVCVICDDEESDRVESALMRSHVWGESVSVGSYSKHRDPGDHSLSLVTFTVCVCAPRPYC